MGQHCRLKRRLVMYRHLLFQLRLIYGMMKFDMLMWISIADSRVGGL